MPIAAALTTFRAEVTTFQGFVTKAFTQNAAGTYFLTSPERSFVVDSAFLRIFIAWESFLEEVFVHYLRGQPSATGRLAVRHATPSSDQHAREILIGTQKYVDWSNPEIVRKLARLYFSNGEPIDPAIGSIQNDLFDLKTVRNAAAHLTSTTGRSLDALASRRLGRVCTNTTVNDFVLSADPATGGTTSVLDGYLAIIDAGAHNIANWT